MLEEYVQQLESARTEAATSATPESAHASGSTNNEEAMNSAQTTATKTKDGAVPEEPAETHEQPMLSATSRASTKESQDRTQGADKLADIQCFSQFSSMMPRLGKLLTEITGK